MMGRRASMVGLLLATFALGCNMSARGEYQEEDDEEEEVDAGAKKSTKKMDASSEDEPPEPEPDASNVIDLTPDAGVGDAFVGWNFPICGLHIVGYGITQAGADDAGDERKGGSTCVIGAGETTLSVKASTLDACPGDSGGPLYIEGTNTILGVLSGGRVVDGTSCVIGTTSTYVSLNDVRTFIDTVFAQNPAL